MKKIITLLLVFGFLVSCSKEDTTETAINIPAKIKLANQFNITKINFKTDDKQTTIDQLIELIKKNDSTYSPLALYFLIDNKLTLSRFHYQVENLGICILIFGKLNRGELSPPRF
jgi:F420-0:gamma-glutamyl ligase-like protein